MNTLIQNKEQKVSFNAIHYYDADYKLSIFNQDTNEIIYNLVSTSEATELIDDITLTLAYDAIKDDNILTLDDATNVYQNQRYTLKGYTYKIDKVNGVEISITPGLLEDVTIEDNLIHSGLLGIYSKNITIPSVGNYVIKATSLKYSNIILDTLECIENPNKNNETGHII